MSILTTAFAHGPPARHTPTSQAFDVKLRSVDAWVESLPMANVRETGPQLFAAVRKVNQMQLAPAERFGFLESVREAADSVTDVLEKQYLGKAFPLTPRERKAADAVRAFHAQMALGYTLVADALAQQGSLAGRLHRRKFACSTYHAISYLSRILFTSYKVYAPCPEHVWQQVHKLYQVAMKRGVSERPLTDEGAAVTGRSSITDIYKGILLLAVLSPYQLPQGDVNKLHAALGRWAPHCKLVPLQMDHDNSQGLFRISSQRDAPPEHLSPGSGAGGPLDWILDTRPLRDRLRKEAETYHGKHSASDAYALLNGLSPELILRLIQSWGIVQKRRALRVARGGDQIIEVALGFSVVLGFVSGEIEFWEEASEEEDIVIETSAWKTGIWRAVKRETAACHVKDESPTGYRLQWLAEHGTIQVGELVGIRRLDGQGSTHWSVGIVRWMRGSDRTSIEFGVEVLALDAESATLCPCNDKGACSESLDVLLLAAGPTSDHRKTLLAPAFIASHPERFELTVGTETVGIRIKTVVETAGLYARYDFELASPGHWAQPLNRRKEDIETVPPAWDETKGDEETDDLDAIWSTL